MCVDTVRGISSSSLYHHPINSLSSLAEIIYMFGGWDGTCDLCDLWQGLINAEISSRIGELLPWKHRDEEREASGQRVPRGRGG